MDRAKPDDFQFRNGYLARMKEYLEVGTCSSSQKNRFFVELFGECLTVYKDEARESIVQAIDLYDAAFLLRTIHDTHTLHVSVQERAYSFDFSCIQQAVLWTKAFRYASRRRFEDDYILGARFAKSQSSQVHYAIPKSRSTDTFAVKISSRSSCDPLSFKMLQKECYINSCLSHASLVQAVDIYCTSEKVYLVMEFMRGGTLRSLLDRSYRLTEACVREVVMQATRGLVHLHSKNIVHRDVCPEKLFSSAHSFPTEIALGDFGNANFFSHLQVGDRAFKVQTGSVQYMAPEMVQGFRYGPAVDVWSLGAVLYELLLGVPLRQKRPGNSHKQSEILEINLNHPAWGSVSEQARVLVVQLLQPDPEKRLSALACTLHPWFFPVYRFPSPPRTASRSEGSDPPGIYKCQSNPSFDGQYFVDHNQQSLTRAVTWPSSNPRNRILRRRSVDSIAIIPFVISVSQRGLSRVARDDPYRFEKLMQSRVVQKQLSIRLRLRRKLMIIGKCFVFVFRLRALAKGFCATRYVPCNQNDVVLALRLIEKRVKGL